MVVEDGLKVKELPVSAPGCKVYVLAPPGVSTVLLPEQIVAVPGTMEIVGVMLTVTCAVGVLTEGQFCRLAPLKEYVAVDVGLSVKELPVSAPGCKVYV